MSQRVSYVDLFSVDAMIPELEARSKSEALAELVGAAIAGGVLPKGRRQEVVAALAEREERGTTGLGRGLAIPHAKIEGLRRHACLVARSNEGVDFKAVDGEPVYVLIMLVSPASRHDEHLGMLRWVSGLARDHDFVSFIRQARTREQILEVLEERAG